MVARVPFGYRHSKSRPGLASLIVGNMLDISASAGPTISPLQLLLPSHKGRRKTRTLAIILHRRGDRCCRGAIRHQRLFPRAIPIPLVLRSIKIVRDTTSRPAPMTTPMPTRVQTLMPMPASLVPVMFAVLSLRKHVPPICLY